MVEVLVSWIFIGITSYVIGFELLEILCKLTGVQADSANIPCSHKQVLRCLLGLCAVNVYAEVFSFFSGVGMWADYLLMFACLFIVFMDRERIGNAFNKTSGDTGRVIRTGIYAVFVIIMAYGTSRGYMHFDTNLYHAQAIHWIEDYGVVPGLANLQSRFGYNSAEFALNALFGLKWYTGRSLHTSAGFFALLSAFVVIGIKGAAYKDESNRLCLKPRISDYIRIGLIFYLGMIFTEMISPASDYYATLLMFDIMILWFDAIGEKCNRIMSTDKQGTPDCSGASDQRALQGILCILLVYAITIKLSLAPLVLLALIPGIYWVRSKNTRAVITCLLSGLIISVPYFIRGFFISGWILYPSTLIKIGSPDWQIPKGMAQYDAREIGMWGRGITRAEDWADVTAFNWMGNWFTGLHIMEKTLVLSMFMAVVIIAVFCIISLVKKSKDIELLLPLVIISIGSVFWFCSAPLIRYGYAYLCILPFAAFGFLMTGTELKNIRISGMVFAIVFFAVFGLRLFNLCRDIVTFRSSQYYVNQQDYIDGDAFTYTVDGMTIYVAEDSGQIGYYKIPSTVEERHDFELRGTDISDGFRHINN